MEPSSDQKPQSNFTAQNATAEDLLKSQTSGLVTLSDFRKRRAEAFEVKEKEAQDASRGVTPGSGVSTPRDGASTPQPPKKKKKAIAKGKLSFGVEDEGENSAVTSSSNKSSSNKKNQPTGETQKTSTSGVSHTRVGPNQAVAGVPRILSKAAQLKETETRDRLRKEFLAMQEAVKATEILVPFVFYDGSSIPGGVCKVKKGDHIWLMLDRSRKVGAELGVGGSDKSKKEWARVSVDDLMLVQGEIIIPHHYEFYYFLVNKTQGFNGSIFEYSDRPTAATPTMSLSTEDLKDYNPLSRPGQQDKPAQDDSQLEGAALDPTVTKVVDRRWYEKNKHIFPASTWEDFDPTKDYTKGSRKDTQGNRYFFS
ncbi:hypothetical protein FH972_022417 [Carpinus fangiana]|uniref:FAM50A/XAP5 C-terminal domain-containing protein n=1 Tax=Carpinus fangiana TaxID=176857 RepID=A0A5N6KSK3_9ROSI|nr:hypothetical protein FH972_022417 [Carpinus fangiana]